MSFPRYPEYKDSGVEWLREVPEGWEVTDGRRLFQQDRTPALPDDEQLSATQKYGVIPQKLFMELQDQKVTLALSGLDNFKHVDQGDFVISLRSFQGGIEQTAHSGCVSPAYTVLKPASSLYGRFWNYLLKSRGYIDALQSMTDGIRDGKSISYGQFGQIPVPQVPLPEQTAIAAFLDRETAKIDALVAEQRRLMELLKEKRQAVISHAVTKGLDPDAPMKPSGIEWLGEVPAHWAIRKISHFFRAGKGKNGQMLTKEFCGANGGDYPVYSGQTENDGIMGTWDQFEFDFGEKGVLLSTTVGAKAMYLRQLFGQFSLSQNCMIIWSTSDRCETRFYYYHFQPLFQFERALIPEHMQASFRIEDLYGYKVAVPPMDEQQAITDHLDAQTANFDLLTAEAQRAIALLQERRTALISAAVTGQIDVRDAASLAG